MKSNLFLTLLALIISYSAYSQTDVSGSISTNTTWTVSGSPYIIRGEQAVVEEGIVLTINPGVIVKFESGFSDLIVHGSLIAEGTANIPIIFTSLSDDDAGGDTNGDGAATKGEPGQWAALWFTNTSSASLKYCDIAYGGGAGTSAMINIRSSDVIFENCNITQSAERGVWVQLASPQFLGCTFRDHATEGLYFDRFGSSDPIILTNNIFENNIWAVLAGLNQDSVDIILTGNIAMGQAASGVGRNGFGLTGSGRGQITFDGQSDFPFIIAGEQFQMLEGSELTITPGTVVKFDAVFSDLVIDGALIAEGAMNAPIMFTSLSDDRFGSDTNGDGAATIGEPGQWAALWFTNTSSASLKYCDIAYGGGAGTSAMINIRSSDVIFENCNITQSVERGVWVQLASPQFLDCTFRDHATEGLYFDRFGSSDPIILTNNIFENNIWAVLAGLNQDSVDIILTGNIAMGQAASGVGRNGFGLTGSGRGQITFDGQSDFPFIIAGEQFQMLEGSELTITPGTVVKFDAVFSDLVIDGALIAEGAMNAPIMFTSLSDDRFGGDTNGDGAATIGEPGQWAALWFTNTSSASLKYCDIAYGGGAGTSAMINIRSSDVIFENCNITQSVERGVWVQLASPQFSGCTFRDHATEGLYFDRFGSSDPIILTNNIFENNIWAVLAGLNQDSVDIILTGNIAMGQAASGVGRNGFGLTGSGRGRITFDGQSDFPIIIGGEQFQMLEGSELTITPGTVVKFDAVFSDLVIDGALKAEGTVNAPIIFTSLFDDRFGGDANGDGTATVGAAGQWAALWLNTSSSVSMKYCHLSYGGGSGTSAIINVRSSDVVFDSSSISNSAERGVWAQLASPQFLNCTVRDHAKEGIYFDRFGPSDPIVMTNNIFENNTWAVLAGLNQDSVDIILTGNTATGQAASGVGRNGFGLTGSGRGQITFVGQDDFPIIIGGEQFQMLAGSQLTITPGTIVKFDAVFSDLVIDGELIAEGTATEPIVFTSLFDDTVGGDANGDSTETQSVPGQWGAIWLGSESSASMAFNCLKYGGGAGTSAILNIYSDNVFIENSAIGQSPERAIYIQDASPTISKGVIHTSNEGIYTAGASSPLINQCDIINNRTWGIFNSNTSLVLDATQNFWGSALGPKNETDNPLGNGNGVNDAVNFSNWLTNLSDQTLIPKPAFLYLNSGQNYSFDNYSPFESNFIWSFGDGDSSLLRSPFHRFEFPGQYDVCLTGTSECAVRMTQCDLVSVKGITSIVPDRGGNSGEVTITVTGVGFTIDSYFELVLGNKRLTSDQYVLTSSGALIGTIDLTGAELGLYDLEVTIPGEDTFVKINAFKVEQGTVAQPWVTITGRPDVLLGAPTKFTIDYGNKGNTDAKSVPITIAISDLPDLEIEFPEIQIDFPPFVDSLDPNLPLITNEPCFVIVESVQGVEEQMRVYTFHIPIMAALSVQSIDLTVSSRESYTFMAWAGTSFYPGGFDEHYVECFVEIIREFGYSETVIDLITVDKLITQVEYIFNYYYEEYGIIGCWDWYWTWAIMETVQGQLSYLEVIEIVQQFTAVYVDAYAYEEINIECIEIIIPHDVENWPVNVVTSFDPNEKTGIIGETENNYIGDRSNMTYTIFFENKDSAQVPAHTIVISDTLDLSAFDIRDFAFEDIYIGEYRIVPELGSRSFVGELWVQDSTVIARIEASLDSINGIIEWRMRSFDPITGEEVVDPFIGILPPNLNSPEGEGSVTFTLGLHQPVSDGDVILNKASIYFDFNEPIVTNTFVNTFDLDPPESRIDALASMSNDTIPLTISGSDNTSGIELYQVWVAKGQEDFELWRVSNETELTYIASSSNVYHFYSVAYDKVGNIELTPEAADASTEVTTGIEDIDFIFYDWNIIPNPTNGFINITGSTSVASIVRINLLNMLGQRISVIYDGVLPLGKQNIEADLSDLAEGIYFIEFNKGKSTSTIRIIKI